VEFFITLAPGYRDSQLKVRNIFLIKETLRVIARLFVIYVHVKPFKRSLMFAIKAGAYPSEEAPLKYAPGLTHKRSTFQVLHTRIGSWPYPQTLH